LLLFFPNLTKNYIFSFLQIFLSFIFSRLEHFFKKNNKILDFYYV
jgi:hypothetical protein